MEEEDERREAAIASAVSLQPNFKPKSGGVTTAQLSKFQELHKRRLQMKAKSKTKQKTKGLLGGIGKEITDDKSSATNEDSSVENVSFVQQDNVGSHRGSKKRQKLHWGLDTKERWEMKANM